MSAYIPPTQDEIDRVAAYWDRLKLSTCEHRSITMGEKNRPTCAECYEQVQWISEFQIDQIRATPEPGSLAEDFDRYLTRGGVTFLVDSAWQDVRFTAHPLPGFDSSGVREYACMNVEDVALLLRATEIGRR